MRFVRYALDRTPAGARVNRSKAFITFQFYENFKFKIFPQVKRLCSRKMTKKGSCYFYIPD